MTEIKCNFPLLCYIPFMQLDIKLNIGILSFSFCSVVDCINWKKKMNQSKPNRCFHMETSEDTRRIVDNFFPSVSAVHQTPYRKPVQRNLVVDAPMVIPKKSNKVCIKPLLLKYLWNLKMVIVYNSITYILSPTYIYKQFRVHNIHNFCFLSNI